MKLLFQVALAGLAIPGIIAQNIAPRLVDSSVQVQVAATTTCIDSTTSVTATASIVAPATTCDYTYTRTFGEVFAVLLNGNLPPAGWDYWLNFENFFIVGIADISGAGIKPIGTDFAVGNIAGTVFIPPTLTIDYPGSPLNSFDLTSTYFGCFKNISTSSDPPFACTMKAMGTTSSNHQVTAEMIYAVNPSDVGALSQFTFPKTFVDLTQVMFIIDSPKKIDDTMWFGIDNTTYTTHGGCGGGQGQIQFPPRQ